MDYRSLKARGTSTTRKAWITNPLRSVLWQLMLPYFQGVGDEIERRGQIEATSLMEGMERYRHGILRELMSLQEDVERRRHADFALLLEQQRTQATSLYDEGMREVTSRVTSHLAGFRKDAMALAHRLAGLEEEAASAETMRTQAETMRTQIVERLDAAAAEAHEAAAYVSALHADVRSSSQALGESVAAATAAAQEAAAFVTSLDAELHSSVKMLNERVDFLTRAAPLRAGDRVSVGEDDLIIVATASRQHFLVRKHDLIGHLIAEGREWEPHVRAAIERAARPDAVAVDAGAYIGLHTVTMSRSFRLVYAFEPQRGIYQVLCGNLALNGCLNVIAHNSALYDCNGSMRLAPPERQEVSTPLLGGQPDYSRISNAAALTFEVVETGSGEVHATKLDDLHLEEVALVKVDTQGADLRVLRGAEDTLRRCRSLVLFEWERDLAAQHGTKLDDYYSFFAAIGYDIAVLQETSVGRQADYIATPR
jgi:FkbM family methyltransferase